MRALAVIPAPTGLDPAADEPLRLIAGKPMVIRVCEAARACKALDAVLVATDSDEIVKLCREHGFDARMTSPAHRSGTERVQEIAQAIHADVFLNIQGDEPLTRPEHIDSLLALMPGRRSKSAP